MAERKTQERSDDERKTQERVDASGIERPLRPDALRWSYGEEFLDTTAMHLRHFIKTFGVNFPVQMLTLAGLQEHVNRRAKKKGMRNCPLPNDHPQGGCQPACGTQGHGEAKCSAPE